MSAKSFDTIVIGAGCAGFSAALALKARDRSVAVLAQNGGATSVSSGAWDFGPIPASGPFSLEDLRASRRWQGLYRKLWIEDQDLARASELQSAAEDLADALEPRLKLSFDFKRAFCLPTSQGLWKRTFGAQELQARADLRNLKGKRIGLVTSDHFRFRADLVAKCWVEQAAKLGERLDISPLWIHWNIPNGDWPIAHLAARIQRDESFRTSLRNAIEERLEGSHFDLLLFPPLFVDPEFANTLQKELHVPVAECLATVEPTAGYRLTMAMAQTLKSRGIPYFTASQIQAETSDGLARGLRYYSPMVGHLQGTSADANSQGWQEIKANSYVLATGKIFGGGIKLGYERVEESVFHLPLFAERGKEEISRRSDLGWDANTFRDEQPWARLGVWLDREYRPLDKAKNPVLRNVSACGGVVGGIDFARAGLGMGLMAYLGRQSGKRIS